MGIAFFETLDLSYLDDQKLYDSENIHPRYMGMVVDYLSRYLYCKDKFLAFRVSLRGAEIMGKMKYSFELLNEINEELTDECIISACKLTRYDVATRIGPWAFHDSEEEVTPNELTIHNIRVMVQRSIKFFEMFGPITEFDFTLGDGYGEYVDRGDGDFLTETTVWDMKVSKYPLSERYALQLAIYYIMGKRSSLDSFKNITFTGIYNPRKNEAYVMNMMDMPDDWTNKIIRKVLLEGNDEIES